MNTTTLIALGILVVLVVLYVGRRRSRLRREDMD
jgi:LPXTG-motif cell wall-anchored protein